MFNECSIRYISKLRSFLQRHGKDFLLEIHNHYRHIFSQYSKQGKRCYNGSSFVIPFTPIQARLFYCLKVQERVFKPPPPPPSPMISGTIQASTMDLCTVIVLLKAYQITKRNFQKSDFLRH